MENEPDVDAVAKENERLFSDQMDIDKRVMAGDEDAVQESSDNIAAAKSLNQYHGADLEQIARTEMESEEEHTPDVQDNQKDREQHLIDKAEAKRLADSVNLGAIMPEKPDFDVE